MHCKKSAAKVTLRVCSVTSSQRSTVWEPSNNTSGSTIGTNPHSWQSAAYRASAWALASRQVLCRNSLADGDDRTPFGELGTEILIFLNASPKSVEPLGYNFTGKARNIYRPFIHFDAGHDALFESSWGNGVPSKAAVRMVSSKRITPLMASSMPLVVKSMSR